MSFLSQLHWRYATKKFNAQKIPEENLEQILEAIQLAPTSFGLQPFHCFVVTDPDMLSKIRADAWDQEQVTTSSHLIVFAARTDLSVVVEERMKLVSGGDDSKRAEMSQYEAMISNFAGGLDESGAFAWSARQSYIALGFALAACAELEIDSCPMEGFNPDAVTATLGMPRSMKAVALMAVGFRSAEDTPHAKQRFSKASLFSFVE